MSSAPESVDRPAVADKTGAAPIVSPQSAPIAAQAGSLPVRDGAGAARELRRKRARRIGIGLAVWVGLPFLLSIVYYGFVAQDEYESVAQFALRGGEATQRGAMLQAHLTSRETLDALEKSAQFPAHFRSSRDPFERLSTSAGSEGKNAAFKRHVTVEHDTHRGIITVRVRAYSGAAAHNFAMVITHEGERFASRVRGQSRERALTMANERLANVKAHLSALARSTSPADDIERSVQKQLGEREFESALKTVELANEALARDEADLIVVASPSRPTEPSYPRRLYGIATVLVVALLMFGVGSLLIGAVREHAQF